ncbi:MAG: hypothetical protein AAF432_03875 [Planctomycetota bacterium]
MTTTDMSTPAAHLVALLTTQEDRVARLVQLASRQTALIAEQKTDVLLSILEQRQKLIGAFSQAQNEINEFASKINDGTLDVTPDERARIRSLIDGISTRIEQVVARDAEDQDTLTAWQHTTGDKLRQIGAANKARGAYLKPNTSTNRFADAQG